jgi:D-3-phosphoglycerate dehydrogenase
VQQIAPPQIATLRITYWGKIVDLDVNAVTRAIQRGFLRRISGNSVNFVNAPVALERLGVRAEIVKSTDDSGYSELIRVEAITPDNLTFSASGTFIGKSNQPRIVSINGREVEVAADGKLLVLENLDQPGMVGTIGTILGQDQVNIADMSLSRLTPGGTAYMVVRVDTEPSESARAGAAPHAASMAAGVESAAAHLVLFALPATTAIGAGGLDDAASTTAGAAGTSARTTGTRPVAAGAWGTCATSSRRNRPATGR